ncbi:MAG: hypothetical protein IJU31_07090 [Synergistaceae bacterium]|nr:hypothetical protein [Synergistaceae bacterium]
MATDFERLRAMKDEDIDCSDIPELTEEYLNSVEGIWVAPGSEFTNLAINGKVFNYFRNTGKGYLNRLNVLVNDLLADYVNKQQAQEALATQ